MTTKEQIKQLKARLDAKDYKYSVQQLAVIISTYKEITNDKVDYPFCSESFLDIWSKWLSYKKIEHNFRYKSIYSLQGSLNKLSNLANGDEETAIKIITQSIEGGWKGFFELKTNNNGKANNRISEGFKQRVANDLFN